MGVDIEMYRARIGCFNCRSSGHSMCIEHNTQGHASCLGILVLLILALDNIAFFLISSLFILAMCSDIHPNPGPIGNSPTNRVSFCNFNIRSIGTKNRFDHIVEKMGGTYDIITISETWLKPKTPRHLFQFNQLQ